MRNISVSNPEVSLSDAAFLRPLLASKSSARVGGAGAKRAPNFIQSYVDNLTTLHVKVLEELEVFL